MAPRDIPDIVDRRHGDTITACLIVCCMSPVEKNALISSPSDVNGRTREVRDSRLGSGAGHGHPPQHTTASARRNVEYNVVRTYVLVSLFIISETIRRLFLAHCFSVLSFFVDCWSFFESFAKDAPVMYRVDPSQRNIDVSIYASCLCYTTPYLAAVPVCYIQQVTF